MILGEYSATIFPLIAATSGLLSVILCQVIAVYLGHQLPFPHAYISATAQHYPQFVIFRIGTISGTVFIIISHFANYFWLQTLAYQNIFNLRKYYPKIGLILGIAGGLFLFVSTASIDTGHKFKNLHSWCAVSFFISTILSIFYNTSLCLIIKKKTGKISNISIYFKLFLSLCFIIQIFIMQNESIFHIKNLDKILEYTLTFTILAYFYNVAYDLKDFCFINQKIKN